VGVVTAPPKENVPCGATVQSLSFVAPILSAIDPGSQLLIAQLALAPPKEKEPCAHKVQPSTAVTAPTVVEYYPAAHV